MSLKKLGRYDLIRVLGKGAMGIVYEGKDPNLDRRVAIKTVKVENLSEEAAAEYEARFRTEARSAARLQHPNIVSVYDSDRDGDIAFLVMEYIQGDDLKHHLDKGLRYSLEQSLKMIRDLLSALDYAHKQGIVHRDIKPANLLIEPGGRVKLTDFGVARIQDSGEATRTQGSMVGTLKYMSPEQVQGQKIDARADLFSVGVVLYQLLTDKRPFDGDNDFSIIHQIIGHTPAPPSAFNGRLPPAIDAVVARALAKNRDERFSTARDFASALQSAIRRAEDATVVPPADPGRRQEGTSNINPSTTGSVITGSAMTSPSTVTQEVELVYWKDIKDSVEPEEFESFLSRFPAGIYADLARRRLRKLTGGAITGDQTVLGGVLPGKEQDLDATRMRPSTFTAPLVVAQPPATGAPAEGGAPAERDSGPPSESSTFSDPDFSSPPFEARAADLEPESISLSTPGADGTAPPVQPPSASDFRPEVAAPTSAATAAQAPAPDSLAMAAATAKVQRALKKEKDQENEQQREQQREEQKGETAPVAAPAGKKPPIAVMAGVGAVAVIAIAAFLMTGEKTPPARVAAAASAASSAPVDVPVAAITAPVAVAPDALAASAPGALTPLPARAASVAAAAASASSAAALKASAPRRGASAPSPRTAPSAPVAEPSRSLAVTPAAPVLEDNRAASAAAVLNVPNPVEQCKDKVFLSREFCLAEHCDKPGSRNHPLCVQRREDIKMREDSKIRQGPQ